MPSQSRAGTLRRRTFAALGAVMAIVVAVLPPNPGAGALDGRGQTLRAAAKRSDADRDGLNRRFELRRSRTSPHRRDTDRDGLTDGFEWRRSKTSARRPDTDRDGVADALELMLRTNPKRAGSRRRPPDGPGAPPSPSRPCDVTASGAAQARSALMSAAPGQVVCLVAGSHGELDLRGINKADYVTLRGAPGFGSVVSRAVVDGSSFVAIEGFHFTGPIEANAQTVTHHIAIRSNEIGPARSGIVNTPSWNNAGHHDWLVERNFFHDIDCDWPGGCPSIGPGYAIAARGNAPRWTVRYNRFERILEDMIQSGEPDGWTVDHNWFGPGMSDRPSGYTGHPDVWQTLESGTDMTWTNNVVRDTNQSLGFIFGDMSCCNGFVDIEVRNNLFVRPVYGVGETCQFSPTNGFVFEQNTLVDARGCRWGGGGSADWPDGQNYSIKRNLLAGNSRLSCNDTSAANSCNAFNAGASNNVSRRAAWRDTTWYEPIGLPADTGARLGPAHFRGYPFDGEVPDAGERREAGVLDAAPTITRRSARKLARAMVRRETKGRVRRFRAACSGTGTPLVSCFLTWRIGRFAYRGDALLGHQLRKRRIAAIASLGGVKTRIGCRRCRSKRLRW
jgi:hypothetical protein